MAKLLFMFMCDTQNGQTFVYWVEKYIYKYIMKCNLTQILRDFVLVFSFFPLLRLLFWFLNDNIIQRKLNRLHSIIIIWNGCGGLYTILEIEIRALRIRLCKMFCNFEVNMEIENNTAIVIEQFSVIFFFFFAIRFRLLPLFLPNKVIMYTRQSLGLMTVEMAVTRVAVQA